MKNTSHFILTLLIIGIFSKQINAQSITCLTFQPGDQSGYDAEIWSLEGTTNYGDWPELKGNAWTWGGDPGYQRALLQFVLTDIPAGVILDTAKLSLYAVDSPDTQLHYGDDVFLIQRIIEDWDENVVTWDSQPATTNENQVTLPAATSGYQDYLNIDVLALLNDMLEVPGENFGFMLRLQDEVTLRRITFASSDNLTTDNHPRLEVCYHFPVAINDYHKNELNVYPSPFNQFVVIESPVDIIGKEIFVKVFDLNGRKIKEINCFAGNTITLDLDELSNQQYVLVLSDGYSTYTKIITKD